MILEENAVASIFANRILHALTIGVANLAVGAIVVAIAITGLWVTIAIFIRIDATNTLVKVASVIIVTRIA